LGYYINLGSIGAVIDRPSAVAPWIRDGTSGFACQLLTLAHVLFQISDLIGSDRRTPLCAEQRAVTDSCCSSYTLSHWTVARQREDFRADRARRIVSNWWKVHWRPELGRFGECDCFILFVRCLLEPARVWYLSNAEYSTFMIYPSTVENIWRSVNSNFRLSTRYSRYSANTNCLLKSSSGFIKMFVIHHFFFFLWGRGQIID